MSLGAIEILFIVLAYYALRMTMTKCARFNVASVWMLRVSAHLLLISVAITGKHHLIGLEEIPIIGILGFILYGIALGMQGLTTTAIIRDIKDNKKYKSAYTWDMVVVGVVGTLWITILIAMP